MKVKGFLRHIVYSVSSHFFTSWGFSQSNLGKKTKKEKKREEKVKKERKKKKGWLFCSYYFDSEADF